MVVCSGSSVVDAREEEEEQQQQQEEEQEEGREGNIGKPQLRRLLETAGPCEVICPAGRSSLLENRMDGV